MDNSNNSNGAMKNFSDVFLSVQHPNFPQNIMSEIFTRPPPPSNVFPKFHSLPNEPNNLLPQSVFHHEYPFSVPPPMGMPSSSGVAINCNFDPNAIISSHSLPRNVSSFYNDFETVHSYPPQLHDLEESDWIKNWVEDNVKFKSAETNKKCSFPLGSSVKIREVAERISRISILLANLESSSKSLSVVSKSISNEEWNSRCIEIEQKKERLHELLDFFNDKNLIMCIKRKLVKRKKKRLWQKKRRDEWKKEKIDNSIKRQEILVNIDKWLEDMKETVDRGRRDEELKREADSVLADITLKKTEAKKQIALLSGLLKLREARVTAQRAIGRAISEQQTDAFNSVIDRLIVLWNKQLKEYTLEEQGLKVMLNDAVVEEKNNETLRKKEILTEWEKTLFGDSKFNKYEPQSIDDLVESRKQWDQFVVEEGSIMCSSIPVGWVVPVKGSDSNWKLFNK